MNMKAIIASLVLGSSSVALAAPAVTFSASAHSSAVVHSAPVYSRASYERPWFARSRAQRPVTLATGMQFSNDGRSFINVGDQLGRFGSLQISASGGRTFIKQVYVQFDNGQEQVIRDVNRTLVGSQSLTLDLDGHRRGIRRIVVYGADHRGFRRAMGTFSVTAV
jgi:hypothetical protein